MELPVEMNSLWEATASTWNHTHMDGDLDTDIAIVGAGITGLSAALRAAESGHSVVLVDAQYPGWGASGRNGGQVIPGLKVEPDQIIKRFGSGRGEHVVRFAGQTADQVFDLIDRHNIDCDTRRGEWVELAGKPRALAGLKAKCEQWQACGADVQMLDAEAAAKITGSTVWPGGFLDRRGGSVQPLKYSTGLGQAARKAGAQVYSHVIVETVERQGDRFTVKTDKGTISANRVLLCTNAYTDPSFGLKGRSAGRSVAPVVSIQIATDPLPDDLQRRIMPNDISGSDTNRLLVYFRQDTEGRFLIGGRGATFASGLNHLFPKLQGRAITMFPELADIPFKYRWGGMLALTWDHYPHIHEPVPGLIMAMGYNGRGVALATQWGAAVADYAITGEADQLPIPISSIKDFPFHRLRTIGIEATAFWYGLLDRMGL